MSLNENDILRICEALILATQYTGDKQYTTIVEKIQIMEKEWKEERKRRLKF